MKLSMQTRDDRLHISVDEPRLDAAVATAFKDKVREVLSQTEQPVTLDLGQVLFLGKPGGLGAFSCSGRAEEDDDLVFGVSH